MRAATIFCLLAIAGATEYEVGTESKFAYVTMWVNKATAPAHVFEHTLSKSDTVSLNSAGSISAETGRPDLNPHQKVRTSLSLMEEEGKPKLKQEEKEKVQKTPLRPRNNEPRGITDLAKNLRDVGAAYPLVVMTNAEELRNATLLAEHPNLKLLWLNESDFLHRDCKIGAGHQLHFQKLMLWKLTQFEKLIWLDTDLAFTNSVDYAFKEDTKNGNRIYGQIDDYQCDGRTWSPTSGGICTGMLLVQPNKDHFNGLMLHQKKMPACWGDQSIVSTYFNGGAKKEAFQFKRSTINFARCKKQDGHMDVFHFSGSPDAKRIGDPEGFKRTSTGMLVNQTALKIKAQEKALKDLKEKNDKREKMDAKKKKSLLQK